VTVLHRITVASVIMHEHNLLDSLKEIFVHDGTIFFVQHYPFVVCVWVIHVKVLIKHSHHPRFHIVALSCKSQWKLSVDWQTGINLDTMYISLLCQEQTKSTCDVVVMLSEATSEMHVKLLWSASETTVKYKWSCSKVECGNSEVQTKCMWFCCEAAVKFKCMWCSL